MSSSALLKRQPLTAFGKVTLGALLVDVLAFVLLLTQIGEIITPIAIVIVCLLVASGFIAIGWRWAPLLGAAMGAGSFIGGQSYTFYHLSHPNEFGFFAASTCIIACGIVQLVGGIGATLQNYRGERQAPRWLYNALFWLIGVVIGALLVSGLVATTAPLANSAAATGTNATPTVHMGPGSFLQTSVVVPKGAKLQLVDDGAFTHIIKNGSWDTGGKPITQKEAGAPTVDITVNSGTAEIGPFNTAGTYHFYCPIHQNMNLTVTVQ